MRITRVTLYQVRMELLVPLQASTHAMQLLHHVLLRMENSDGCVGWGESIGPSDPYYIGETYETVWHMLTSFLVPKVLGREFSTVDEIVATYQQVKGNTFAKQGVEMAVWDLLGKTANKSVAQLLGGTRSHIESGVVVGIEKDYAQLFDRIRGYVDQGYRRVKLKVAPGKDREVIAKVRERFPDVPLMVDGNSAYTLADAEHLKTFDAFGLMMIEQPLAWDDMKDHAVLQKQMTTPLCLDESIRHAEHAKLALDLGACRAVALKPGRVGGLSEAKRVHDVCYARGVPVWCGGQLDYGISRAASMALASLPGFTVPGDLSGSNKYWAKDIIDPPIVAEGGRLEVPTGPGLGIDVDEEFIATRTERTITLEAK